MRNSIDQINTASIRGSPDLDDTHRSKIIKSRRLEREINRKSSIGVRVWSQKQRIFMNRRIIILSYLGGCYYRAVGVGNLNVSKSNRAYLVLNILNKVRCGWRQLGNIQDG